MAVKDWIPVAAAHILSYWPTGSGGHGDPGYYTDEQKANIVRNLTSIISDACPFKDGVAYMPVPRCETCGHFVPYPSEAPSLGGTCIGKELAGETVNADFGCVQWKEKVG